MPLIIGSICAHKSLLLALILSLLSHASHFKGDINIISLKGLVKAIFLFEGVKRRIFGCKIVYKAIYGFRLLIIRFFKEKYLKQHFGNIS